MTNRPSYNDLILECYALRKMLAVAISGHKLYTDDGEYKDDSEIPSAMRPKSADSAYPGKEYRLIDKEKDKPEDGDEYWSYGPIWNVRHVCSDPFTDYDIYRRKLKSVTRKVVLKKWICWDYIGEEAERWQSSRPKGWAKVYETNETRETEIPL